MSKAYKQELNKCYVCKKDIKEGKLFVAIGKDKNGVELYRHQKCYPGLPKYMIGKKK